MHNQPHPDLELLDRLRAGLLDELPDEKAALEKHLADCQSCQTHAGRWEQLGQAALGPQLDTTAIAGKLQTARRHALSGHQPARQQPFIPYATAAMLLIAVSFGLWTWQTDIDSTSQVTARNTQDIPDVYEDLEFYLWLANQDDNGNSDATGNPNNT